MRRSREKDSVDVEASAPQQRVFVRDGQHTVGFEIDSTEGKALWGCVGFVSLGAFIGIIVLLCSIHNLGPEEQVVITGGDGKYVRNGPKTVILSPSRKKEFRDATRLGEREYAVVRNIRTGKLRHEPGPKLLWLGAYDELKAKKTKIVLQLQEYIRLIDQLSGKQRVVVGPDILIPEALESSPNGTEKSIVLGKQTSVLVKNTTTGVLTLIETEGVFNPKPYQVILELRTATLLTHKDYAKVKDRSDGTVRHEKGPMLLRIGAYDQLVSVHQKIILQRDEYVVLRRNDGQQKVAKGPQALVPSATETMPRGIQKAAYIDVDTAVIARNRVDGQKRLVQKPGLFFPSPEEDILETRQLIRVLPTQALVVRDEKAQRRVEDGRAKGGKAFFLGPYESVDKMMWSSFGDVPDHGKKQVIDKKVEVTAIDLRLRKIFFRYDEVLDKDSVKLQLDGTIFWSIKDVGKMINITKDPEGDVYQKSRKNVVEAVSKVAFRSFMASLANITADAIKLQKQDSFFHERGIELHSIDITAFELVDPKTAENLHKTIQEATNRINQLAVQLTINEVNAVKLKAEIELEKQRTELITTQSLNKKLEAQTAGDSDGMKLMREANSFIGGLKDSVPDGADRLALYKMHEQIKSKNMDTANLASGKAKLFMTPADLNLKMSVGEL